MTNAEKYLKDNIKENDFANMCVELTRFFDNKISMQKVADFFNEQAKPTLTEDEKVILRNIDNYNVIGRDKNGHIRLTKETEKHILDFDYLQPLDHLFQFIKERRRI